MIFALKNLFIHGGFLPALWGPSLLLVSTVLLESRCGPLTWGICFMLPLTVYAYDYLADLELDSLTNSDRSEFNHKWGEWLLAAYAGALLALLLLCMDPLIMVLTASMFITGILYSRFFKGLTAYLTGFKNIYLGLVWSSWTTIPAMGGRSLPAHILVFTFIFLKVYVNTAFSDYKDIESDAMRGLKTLPAVFGENNSLMILQLLNALGAATLSLGVLTGLIPGIGAVAVILSSYTALYLHLKPVMDVKTATLIADLEGPLHLLLGLGVMM
ncbi:UbiA family prenyltransferase [Methanothermobacter thermautotrophicus]